MESSTFRYARMSLVFFATMWMFGTRKVNDKDKYFSGKECVSDWKYLTELSYKKTFESIGRKVYSSDGTNISLIEGNDGSVYRPGEELWEWAKLKARSTAFTLVSLEHLIHYHLSWANVRGTSSPCCSH